MRPKIVVSTVGGICVVVRQRYDEGPTVSGSTAVGCTVGDNCVVVSWIEDEGPIVDGSSGVSSTVGVKCCVVNEKRTHGWWLYCWWDMGSGDLER